MGGTKRGKLELGWAMSPAYAASFRLALMLLDATTTGKRPTSKSSTAYSPTKRYRLSPASLRTSL